MSTISSIEVPDSLPSESYVSADVVADRLSIEHRQVLKLTRDGKLPAHPVDPTARRKIWRYKLSEIDRAMNRGYNGHRSPRSKQ